MNTKKHSNKELLNIATLIEKIMNADYVDDFETQRNIVNLISSAGYLLRDFDHSNGCQIHAVVTDALEEVAIRKTKQAIKDEVVRLKTQGNCADLIKPLAELLDMEYVSLPDTAVGFVIEDFLKGLGLVPTISASGWSEFKL